MDIGNTPAGAGKTLPSRTSRQYFKKHPRGRGENKLELRGSRAAPETPPRARGKHRYFCFTFFFQGNTPAGAGKTSGGGGSSGDDEKHPRGRGENPTAIAPVQEIVKHPRGRGENLERRRSVCRGVETPPRARGKPGGLGKARVLFGNTPAGAGKTKSILQALFALWKHPRGRGENASAEITSAKSLETPPRARGKPPTGAALMRVSGNTPAGAGKTEFRRGQAATLQKHPRGRGENLISRRLPPL